MLPADAVEQRNLAMQPDPVTAEAPNTPRTEQPSAEETTQPQRIFLPIMNN
jgi:hypothetical protein